MSQSAQSEPGRPGTSVMQSRELEELVHRQASALAETPQLGEAELVAELGLRARSANSRHRCSNVCSDSWDHTLSDQ